MNYVTFKVGDTARLKSGGPLMTIEAVEGDVAYTVWFVGTAAVRGTFPTAALDPDDGRTVMV